MSNTSKAVKDIGEVVKVWGGFIDHLTYRDMCYDLAWLVELSDGDITDEQYTDWWNKNISHHDDFSTIMSKEEWNGLGINDSNADFVRVDGGGRMKKCKVINASEAREIMGNALTGMYKEVVESIHKDIVRRSENGHTMTTCYMAPDVFDRYEDELITLLKESGYHVSEPSKSSTIAYFVISWKEESPFYEDQPEQPKWWKFWK